MQPKLTLTSRNTKRKAAMERNWSIDREKLFVIMLAGAVLLTVVLSGLIVADLTTANKPVAAQLGPGGAGAVAGDTGTSTDQGGAGGQGAGGSAGTAAPGAGGSAANKAGGADATGARP